MEIFVMVKGWLLYLHIPPNTYPAISGERLMWIKSGVLRSYHVRLVLVVGFKDST